MSVIKHDFGAQQRQVGRLLRRLLSLDALHEANVCGNPLPYLERASERIYQLEKALFEAVQTTASSHGEPPSVETIVVNKAEYQRLLTCREIVEQALARLGVDEEES